MHSKIKETAFLVSIVSIATLLLTFTYRAVEAPGIKRQAIERGYALHCPIDGKFAWKGECEDE